MDLTADRVSDDRSVSENGEPNTQRPVDLVHLARFTMGNRTVEREVLELFSCQSEVYLQRLKDASTEKEWREAAHTIKGAARGIGAWRVAETAETAEKLEGAGWQDKRASAVQDVEERICEANNYIRTLLKDFT